MPRPCDGLRHGARPLLLHVDAHLAAAALKAGHAFRAPSGQEKLGALDRLGSGCGGLAGGLLCLAR